jgi:hypothetical protein
MYGDSDAMTAAREDVKSAHEAFKAAAAKLRRVHAPASVKLARIEYVKAEAVFTLALQDLTEARRAQLRELEDGKLLNRYCGALNYSYEANMSDYSMGSINRAAEDVEDVRAILDERGFGPRDEIVRHAAGGWVAKIEVSA